MTQFINAHSAPYQERLAREFAAAEEKRNPKEVDITGGIKSAFNNFNLVANTAREQGRQEELQNMPSDTGFILSGDEVASLSFEYGKDEVEYLKKSNSQEELLARKRWIEEDRESFRKIAALGPIGGTAVTMAASVLDPITIGVGALTGGFGVAAKTASFAGKGATFLRAGTAAAVENVMAEAYLRSNSSQKGEYDLLTAGAGGFLLGGLSGVVYRNSRFKKVAEYEQMEAALKAEADARATRIREEALGMVQVQDVVYDRTGIRRWKDESIQAVKDGRRGELINRSERNALSSEIKQREALLSAEKERLSRVQVDAPSLRAAKGAATRTEKNILSVSQETAIQRELDWRAKPSSKRGAHINEQFKNISASTLRNRLKKSKAGKVARERYRSAQKAKQLEAKVKTSEESINAMKAKLTDAEAFADSTNEISRIRAMSDADVLTEIKKTNPDYVPYRAAEQTKLAAENKKTWARLGVKSEVKGAGVKEPTVDVADEFKGAPVRVAENLDRLTKVANDFVNDYVDLRKMGPFAPVANRMIHSLSAPIRGLSRVAFDFGQGGSHARTVDSSMDIHRAKMEAHLGGAFQYGLDLWRKENGYGKLQGVFKGNVEKEYHRAVIRNISRPDPNAPDSVKVATENWRKMTDYAFDKAVEAGEAGFEEGKRLPNYFTTLMNDKAIASYVNDARVGRSVVEQVLAESYHKGAHKIPKRQAQLIAERVVEMQLGKYTSGTGSVTRLVRADAEDLRKLLTRNGVSQKVADEFVASMDEDLALASISNRAKASLGADLSVEVTLPSGEKFGMVDLIEDDISKVANGYMAERAAGISWAQAGFKSRHELNEYLTQAEKLGMEAYPEKLNQIKKEVETMRQAVAAQFGEILPDDVKGSLRNTMRRTRQFSQLMIGGRLGLSAMPDLYRAIVNHGIKNTITASKELNLFTNRDFAKALTTGNAWKNPQWKELNLLVGYRGFDDKLKALTRSIDLEEGTSEGLGAMVDAALAKGIRLNNLLSGLRQVQRGIDQLSIRSSYLDLSKRLIDNNPTDYHLNMMGWDRKTWDRMSELAQEHKGTVSHEGDTFRILNAEMMPGDAQELIGMAISRMHRRNTTRMSVGEAPVMVNKEYGRFLLMFRQFTLGSIEKQLIHDVRAGGFQSAKLFAGSVGFGLMTYATKTIVDAGGEDDPEAYFSERMQGQNLAFGVLANVGQAAGFSQIGDFGASLGMVPRDWYSSSNREGFRPIGGVGDISPATAGVDSIVRNTSGLISSLRDGDLEKAQKSLPRLLPYLNSTAIATGTAIIGGALD